MKILLIIVGTLVVLVGIVLVIGAMLPRTHRVTRKISLGPSPGVVYGVVRDFGAAPSWRSDLRSVELLDPADGRVHFRECSKNGCVNYEVVADVPGEKLVTRILDRDLGYAGSWTYDFAATPEGTCLSITEDGVVSNVLFRFVSRFIFGQASTIERYLASLGSRFGAATVPRPRH